MCWKLSKQTTCLLSSSVIWGGGPTKLLLSLKACGTEMIHLFSFLTLNRSGLISKGEIESLEVNFFFFYEMPVLKHFSLSLSLIKKSHFTLKGKQKKNTIRLKNLSWNWKLTYSIEIFVSMHFFFFRTSQKSSLSPVDYPYQNFISNSSWLCKNRFTWGKS